MPILLLTLLAAVIVLGACAPANPPAVQTPGGQTPPARPTLAVPTRQPVQGDKDRGPVYVDGSDLLIMESFPVQVNLAVSGNLPTPCHRLHVELAAADADNQIHVSLYSTADPNVMCTQVLQPFEESIGIPMQGAADGTYSVWLNGERVGEFEYPG